jgi:UDP-N-acetylglucosamine transferase subunit ALG13
LKQNNINKKIILFPNKTQVKHKVDNQYQQIINQVNDELSNIDWSKISNRE